MRSDLWAICLDIYRQLYREATPPGDFDAMMESGEAKRADFFLNYYLLEDRQTEIIIEHCKAHRLSAREKIAVATTVRLGCSPRGVEK